MFKKAPSNTLTFSISYGNISDYIDLFLDSKIVENKSSDTIAFYRSMLKPTCKWLHDHGIYQWEQLKQETIREYLFELKESGHAQGGIHAFYRAFKAYINWFWDQYDVDLKNPISKVKCSNRKPKPLLGITLEEVNRILDSIEKTSKFKERDRAMIFLLTDCGLRRTELMSLKYKHINCVTGSIFIEHGKGDKSRTVFMGRDCKKILRKYLLLLRQCQPDDTIWYTIDGNPLTINGAREILRRLQENAGFGKIHFFHDFRRCSAVESKRNGGSDIEVSRKLGHSSLEVTKRYFALDQHDDALFGEKSSPMDHRKK